MLSTAQFNELRDKFSWVTALKTYFEEVRASIDVKIAEKIAQVDAFLSDAKRTIHAVNVIYFDSTASFSDADGSSTKPFSSESDALNAIIDGTSNQIKLKDDQIFTFGAGVTSYAERRLIEFKSDTSVKFVRTPITGSISLPKVLVKTIDHTNNTSYASERWSPEVGVNFSLSGFDVLLEVEDSVNPSAITNQWLSGGFGSKTEFSWHHADMTIPAGKYLCSGYVVIGKLLIDLGYLEIKGGGEVVNNYNSHTLIEVNASSITSDGSTFILDDQPEGLRTNIPTSALLSRV